MKKIIILAAMLLTTVCGALATTVNTYYIDTDGQKVTTEATVLTGVEQTLTGTYLVTNTVISQLIRRPAVEGEVKLILADGAAYIATYGISVGSGQSLTIYAQEKGTGLLNAGAFEYCAAIGGTGGKDDDGNLVAGKAGGSVTINGGNVFVKGGTGAAGIGSGYGAPVADNSITLTVNGGYVEAIGGDQGAGIGGGYQSNGGKVTINGGRVKATGGAGAAGIGDGLLASMFSAKKTEFAMTGGEVTAIGSAYIGISAQANSAFENINVSSGTDEDSLSPKMDWDGINGGIYMHLRLKNHYVDTTNDENELVEFKDFTEVTAEQTEWTSGTYLVSKTIENANRITVSGEVKLVLRDGTTLTASQGITVEGDNKLSVYGQEFGAGQLFAAGAESAAGIGGASEGASGGTITIYGGTIEATGANAPGIGGGKDGEGVTFAIYDGTLKASSADANCAAVLARQSPIAQKMVIYNGESIDAAKLTNWDGTNGGASMFFIPCPYYCDPLNDNEKVRVKDFEFFKSSQTTWSGVCVVRGEFTVADRMTVQGEVTLILEDGSKLTASSGITVAEGASLTICGQEKGNGVLEATGVSEYHAGIGVNSKGTTSTEGTVQVVRSGDITINSGIITANGGPYAAGIGAAWMGITGRIEINGGTVTATGGMDAAGIGNGLLSSADTDKATYPSVYCVINGGTVTAYGGKNGCGIGGGRNSNGGTFILNDGTVTANGGVMTNVGGYDNHYKAGIGGASDDEGTTLIIRGGEVTALTGFRVAGTPTIVNMQLYLNNAEDATPEESWDADDLLTSSYVRLAFNTDTQAHSYIDSQKNNKEVSTVNYSPVTMFDTVWQDGTYVVNGQVTHNPLLSTRVRVVGDVKLILADGASFITVYGITVEPGNSLTIYGQAGGTGQLAASSLNECAAIGGGSINAGGGSITICGGKVTADGGTTANGIGGGISGAPATFAIYGGEVTALGMSAIAAAATPVVKNMLIYSGASASEALILNSWNGTNGGEYMHLKLMGATTSTTPNAVPHAWLDQYSEVHGQGTGEGTDYEAAAKAIGKNGYVLWQSYVFGLEPDKEDSHFVVTIEMDENGKPVIDWSPKNVAGRVYTLEGRTLFNDEAGWVEADESTHHFFRVLVDIE